MVNLSRMKLRGLTGLAAVASVAALTVPVPAAQATSTATTPKPAVNEPARVADDGHGHEEQPRALAAGYNSRTALQTVRYNPLYKTPAIPPSKCREVHVSLRTEAGVRAYNAQLLQCMYAAWAPVLKAARKPYKVKPTLVVYSASRANTKCGVIGGTRSVFCGADNGYIYVPWKYTASLWAKSPTYARAYATNTMAHEYGHHLQYVTNILGASWWRQRAFTTNSARLEESRRRELQASCLGSAYIGANKRYYPMSGGLYTQWKYLVEHSGDQPGYPRDHGSVANHGWWSHTGFYAASTKTYAGRCNTWNANSSRVS